MLLRNKFPEELIQDPKMMEVFHIIGKKKVGMILIILGKRLSHCRIEFTSVKLEAIKCINEFLAFSPPETQDNAFKLKARVDHLNQFIANQPKNIALKVILTTYAYSYIGTLEECWLSREYMGT
jgi:hypothetical protein